MIGSSFFVACDRSASWKCFDTVLTNDSRNACLAWLKPAGIENKLAEICSGLVINLSKSASVCHIHKWKCCRDSVRLSLLSPLNAIQFVGSCSKCLMVMNDQKQIHI